MSEAGVSVQKDKTCTVDTALFDTRDADFREDPHAILDRLREAHPVYPDLLRDRFVLSRADDVAAALSDRGLSSNPLKARPAALAHLGLTEADRANPPIIFLDDPDHARLRKPLVHALSARVVNAMRPRIESFVESLLDAITSMEPFELIAAYASPIPVFVIAGVLGIGDADAKRFRRLSNDASMRLAGALTEDERRRVEAADRELMEFLDDCVEDHSRGTGDGLISDLLRAEADGERLTKAEIVMLSRGVLVAGNITTTDMMGNSVVALLQNRAQLDCVLADPALWPSAVEELLRYDPPGFAVQRLATGDREIRGCPIHAGQAINVHLLAANHDPIMHANAHGLDIARADPKHFSFGGGVHFCPGASLARMELQIALRALFTRFPRLRLVVNREPKRKVHPLLNGYEDVWLEEA